MATSTFTQLLSSDMRIVSASMYICQTHAQPIGPFGRHALYIKTRSDGPRGGGLHASCARSSQGLPI